MRDIRKTRLEQIHDICEAFVGQWRAGNRPRIEDCLAEASESLRSELLAELLHEELHERQRTGESATVDDYYSRFPQDRETVDQVLGAADAADPGRSTRSLRQSTRGSVSPRASKLTEQASSAQPPPQPRRAFGPSPRIDEPTRDFVRPLTASPDSKIQNEFPRQFGQYELLAEIARGGMGVVYKARQTRLDRPVAVKMILGGHLASHEVVQRFQVEARAAAALDHVGIVPVYEVGEYQGQHFFSMGLVEGSSLAVKLREGPLPPQVAAEMLREIAQAVDYAHSRGVIHRDLKPGNVLLDQQGHPRVSDFGLAKCLDQQSEMTGTGEVLGTPAYMPPEQASGRHQDVGPRSDVYSLGAIFYCMLTGRPPFQAASPMETLLLVRTAEPVAPRQLNPSIPSDLETIALKCLEKEPARRYESAQAVADELSRFLRKEPILARPITRLERTWRWCRRNRLLATAIASAVLLLVAITFISTYSALRLNDLADRERNETKRANEETGQARRERSKALKLADANAKLAEQERQLRKRERQALQQADANAERARREALLAEKRLYMARMTMAWMAWDENHPGLTRQLLDLYRSPPTEASESVTFRGFEWFFLDHICHDNSFSFPAPGGGALCVTFSPDDRRFATGNGDGSATIWDALDGHPLQTFSKHGENITAIAFSPDGSQLATATADQTVIVWNVSNSQRLFTFAGHKGRLTHIAFSSNGKLLISSGWGGDSNNPGEVKVWDLQTGAEAFSLTGHPQAVTGLSLSPDNRHLATGCWDGTVRVWDLDLRQGMILGKGRALGRNLTYTPDGSQLAITNGNNVQILDASNGQEIRTLSGHAESVIDATYSRDGSRLATAGFDGTFRIWNATDGALIHTFKCQTSLVRAAAINATGTRVVSVSGKTVDGWNVMAEPEARSLKGHRNWVKGVAINRQSTLIASAGWDRTVRVWDLVTGFELLTLKGNANDYFTSVTFSPDGQSLAASSQDKKVSIWELPSGQLKFKLIGHTGYAWDVAYSLDGTRLASGSVDRTVIIWDAISGKKLFTLEGHAGAVASVAFSHDGKRLASASGNRQMARHFDHTVKVWNALSGELLQTMQGHSDAVLSVAFSPDGKKLASASVDQTVKVWNADDGSEVMTLSGHAGAVVKVLYSRDGRRLMTASGDKTIKVWDAETGQETLALKGHNLAVTGLALSDDGLQLVSSSDDGLVKIWDAKPWTPELRVEREAVSLVSFLFDKGLSKRDVGQAVAADASITETVRRRASDIVEQYVDVTARSRFESSQAALAADKMGTASFETAMRVRKVRLVNPSPMVGDDLRIAYELVNTSEQLFRAPAPQKFLGFRQHWIERLGNDSKITALQAAARDGRRYAAGGESIESPVAPGMLNTYVKRLETKGFLPGNYRYSIELMDSSMNVLRTENVEFELKPRAPVTEPPPSTD